MSSDESSTKNNNDASNINYRLVTCLDNAEYLNFQGGYESSNKFKASNE